MINLDNYAQSIKDFIHSSMASFSDKKGQPASIGIYCCPWAGWLTTNFNINKTIEDTGNNCPDFEFVAFDSMDLGDWQIEYEKDEPLFQAAGEIPEYNQDMGDERLNEIVFAYLQPIARGIKHEHPLPLLLQMLDSNYYKVF